MGADSAARQIPEGLIFRIASDAGIQFKAGASKPSIRCPFHEDRHASAFLSTNNVFFCSACTADGGWSAKTFAEALRRDWKSYLPPLTSKQRERFTAADAESVWRQAHARMRDDAVARADSDVWGYLAGRGLVEAFELGAFGIVAGGMQLPPAVTHWPGNGYRIVAPLYDQRGEIANIQARAIVDRDPKTLFPPGSKASGTLFACARAQQVLIRQWDGEKRYLFAEGLTDFLALVITAPVPVFAAPGTSLAVSGVNGWVAGAELLLALDCDGAGANATVLVAKRAYQLGASKVRRITWPQAAKDACQVVERIGIEGLEEFLRRVVLGGAQ